ncbi:ABC transporter ATP-binding protein [Fulvivirgaceae bacterium BMA10]|uniref:ABC transporter ATP-binding protein n=1 Tax=Splendidivirga corallicola TaxID=3051826 RepID=A0ABT8KP59_9BACT|nr:ABC transporter ATP-binding protein [Fulvivirgaceae bacterium BMA10]
MIEINDLTFCYTRKKTILRDVNLNLPSGNVYGLLGKNGAGKSTLLKNIAGLLFPTDGECKVLDYRSKDRLPDFLREIYFIPEEFHLPALSIKRYVDIYSSFYPRFNKDQFSGYLEEYQLQPSEKLTALSYGQKKKIIIGFGLATNCALLIMDEPTNGLDIPSKSQFRKIVASSVTEDRSFIISTHQVRDVESLIDPIIILDEGEIIFNQYFEQVSKKLSFEVTPQKMNDDDILFSQSILGGYSVVMENKTGIETEADLEVLFNTIISDPKRINQIFEDTDNEN